MNFVINTLKSFRKRELTIWFSSVTAILLSFFLIGNQDILTVIASLVGATALILLSKGNVLGQVLTVAFSVLYGIISFRYRYFGEMITYAGMTAPIAIASIVTWLKNAHKGNKMQVTITNLKLREYLFAVILSIAVTIGFYFILRAFNTHQLMLSTISVFTSFFASYLTMRRTRYYALAYALNDVVLIVMWILATIDNNSYLPMVLCFLVFLLNDLYGFINWGRIQQQQSQS